MAKSPSTVFVCSHCDAQFPKWSGRCAECGQWGTLVAQLKPAAASKTTAPAGRVQALHEISREPLTRLASGMREVDRTLGGGFVPGSIVLLGGDPGIGKSTLVLQIARGLAGQKQSVLYVSGEESAAQVGHRLRRLDPGQATIDFLGETNIETIIATIAKGRPNVVVIDSVQTMTTADAPAEAGSMTQVRAVTAKLMAAIKTTSTTAILIGHVTKEGAMAGPKALEHLVDVVLYLEGDKLSAYRLLRSVKNRFGPTADVGVFDMRERGLVEVVNPSRAWLADRQHAPGAVATIILEGSRPFAVEIQALTNPTVFGLPRRTAAGIDLNRLQLLIAVLTRRGGLPMSNHDVYVNVVGGLKISERSCDLAVCLAIASSFRDRAVAPDVLAIGEVGLGGEVRMVGHLDQRLREAASLGFARMIIPVGAKVKTPDRITVVPVATIADALQEFGAPTRGAKPRPA